jgi:hypothetical protein
LIPNQGASIGCQIPPFGGGTFEGQVGSFDKALATETERILRMLSAKLDDL